MDVFVCIFHRNSCLKTDSIDPVQMPHSVASELGLHCLHMSPKRVSSLKKGNIIISFQPVQKVYFQLKSSFTYHYDVTLTILLYKVPYFFSYKTEFFPFQNNPKSQDQDGSRSLRLFRKGKTGIKAKFHRTDLVICSHSRERKMPSYS